MSVPPIMRDLISTLLETSMVITKGNIASRFCSVVDPGGDDQLRWNKLNIFNQSLHREVQVNCFFLSFLVEI